MAILKAFKGFRPLKDKVSLVASRPYDVINSEEAKIEAGDNVHSFLHVVKPEIDLPDDIDHYSPLVYQKAKDNFDKLVKEGMFVQDKQDCLYIYRLTMDGRSQCGIVGAAAVDDYFNNVIKKHELTRPDKEEDRINHVRVSNINAEPVFFAYPNMKALDDVVNKIMEATPENDFTTEDGIRHELWVVSNDVVVQTIISLFAKLPATYVADGHHRTAAAAMVGKERRQQNKNHKGTEEYNFFLAVHFPDNQLHIMDYNRVVKDLNGLTEEELLNKISENFEIEKKGNKTFRPTGLHNFGMYLNKNWYSLTAKKGTYNDSDPIGVLDVTILSKRILNPIFNIVDLRTDKRIDFVGGLRGLGELENRVNSGEMKVAFALHPVTMKQLIDIADTGNIMPPKTTWFEPKLRSGLVVHSLD
ncbi:MAG: DUF1015 domain-containing protein [Sphingobacteriaceae bacterium]|nr:DUF1015 domain-containing protein [Sphingobacteriaceae bacterium]